MSFLKTVRGLFKKSAPPARRHTAFRFRPDLESLDARIVPATRTWNPAGGSTDWATAANWAENAVPTGGDDIVVGAGKGNMVLALTAVKSITTDKGFTNTIQLSGDLDVQSLTLAGGTLKMGHGKTTTITDSGVVGSRSAGMIDGTGTIDDGRLYFTSRNGTGALGYIESAVSKNSAHIKVETLAAAVVKKITFDDVGAFGLINNGVTYLRYVTTGDGYFAKSTGSAPNHVYSNPIDNNKTMTVTDGPFECIAYIVNNDTFKVLDGQTIYVVGRDAVTGGASFLSTAGSKLILEGTAALECTYDASFASSSIQVTRPTGTTGAKAATLNAPNVILSGASSLSFTASDGLLRIMSSGNWDFRAGTSMSVTLDYGALMGTGAVNSLTCSNITIGATTTFTVAKVGVAHNWTGNTIIGTGTKTGDWATYVGVPAGNLAKSWSGATLGLTDTTPL